MKNIKLFFLVFVSILSSSEFEKICKQKLIQKIKNQIQRNNENNQKNLLENSQLNLKLNFYLKENKKNNFPLKTIFENNKNNDYFNQNLNNCKKKRQKIFIQDNNYLNKKIIHNKSNSYEKSFEFLKEKPILINNQNKNFEKIILTPRYLRNNVIISDKPTCIQKEIDEKNWLLIKEKLEKNKGKGNIVITKSIILS